MGADATGAIPCPTGSTAYRRGRLDLLFANATPLTAQDDPAMQVAIDEWLTASVPMGRWGRVEDVAQAVLSLADAGYVTGTEIVVDGGLAQT